MGLCKPQDTVPKSLLMEAGGYCCHNDTVMIHLCSGVEVLEWNWGGGALTMDMLWGLKI